MRKTDYHSLARFTLSGELDPEVRFVLDAMPGVATAAKPAVLPE